ncbi:hypothetical protein Tco_1531462 [Tanacetum coccineum]
MTMEQCLHRRRNNVCSGYGALCYAPPNFTSERRSWKPLEISWKLIEDVRRCRKARKVMEALRSSRSLPEECRIVHSS